MITFYAYGAPGTYDEGENGLIDMRTEKFWKDYKDMGLDMMFLSGKNSFDGNNFENSNTKKCFDIAKKLGIKKVVLRDLRIYADILGGKEHFDAVPSLIGDGCRFKSEQELDDFVKDCLKDYINEKEFTGVSLMDEPTGFNVNAYAQLYQSIKRSATALGKPDILIQTMIERSYFRYFRDAIGKVDYFGIDMYPFKYAMGGESFVFQGDYFSTLQVYADYAKKMGTEFGMVLQSFELVGDWYPNSFHRLFSFNEMLLQMNAVLGFGCKSIGFYTFVNLAVSANSDGGYCTFENSSPLNTRGKKTIYYYWAKNAIDYANKVDKFIDGYHYDGSNIYYGEAKKDLQEFYSLGGIYPSVFKEIFDLSFDDHVALLTRLVNNDDVLYMIENVYDDALAKSPYEKMNACITFMGVSELQVFSNGKIFNVKLKDNKYNVSLSSGEAVFVKIVK